MINSIPGFRSVLEITGGLVVLTFIIAGVGVFSGNLFAGIGFILMGTAFVPRVRNIGSLPINVWTRGGVFVFGFLFMGLSGGETSRVVPQDQIVPSEIYIVHSSSSATAPSEIVEENAVTQSASAKKVIVTDVTDGDTIKVRMSDGEVETVRLIGIDTPETRPTECFGREATAKMQVLVGGKEIMLVQDPADDRDNFGRLLRYVSVEGVDAGAVMIRDGFAHSYKQYPHPRLDEYNVLERNARNTSSGLWGDVCLPLRKQPSSTKGQECVIKGNVNSKKEKIYHYPGCGSYNQTQINAEEGDRWFCTEAEASEAGFRRAGNC